MRKALIKKLTIPLILAVFCTVCSAALEGCSSSVTPKVQTSFFLDTTVSITYYDKNDSKMISNAMNMLSDFELIFSRKNEEAELYRVNQKAGEKVEISEDLYEVLEMALEFSRKTEGAFDFTLGSVSDLYGFTTENPTVPSPVLLQETLIATGYEKVKLTEENGTYFVQVSDPGLVLDLGAIAKGYIADRLKSYLAARDVKEAIINLGGNILLIGERPVKSKLIGEGYAEYQPFSVGIQNPEANALGQSVKTLKLSDVSCVTAGIYQRFFEQDGKIYHHILDPETGSPVSNDLLSVSITGEKSAVCDALSTSCIVLGLEEGTAFLETFYPEYKGYFITSDKQIHEVN